MGNVFSFGWEDQLIIFIQQYMSEAMVKIASAITECGDQLVLVAVIGVTYWALNKELGKRLLVYLGFINVLNPCIKCIVQRLRPYMANPDIKCLKPVNAEGDIYDVVTQDFSFASGHAANSIAGYGTLAKNCKNKAAVIGLVILIILVGVSRFSLGVHYPTDVLAGWVVGCFAVTVYCQVEKRIGRYKTFILLDVLGLVGFTFATTNDFYTGYGLMLGATLGIAFEEKYVNFEETKKPIMVILRTIAGVAVFLGLNTLMKMPFSEEFLLSGTMPAFIVRAARYTIDIFLVTGVYPLCFRFVSGKGGL